jgi:hypothetical protein
MKLLSENVDVFAVLLIAILLGLGRSATQTDIRTARGERRTREHNLSDFQKRFKAAQPRLIFISSEKSPR